MLGLIQVLVAVEAQSSANATARAIAWTIVAAALLALGFGLVHAFRRICPNVDPPDDLPTGRALSTLATHVALRRYAFHALGIIVAGLAGAIVAGSLLRLAGYQQHESGGSDAAGFVGSAGLLVAAFGALCLLNAARIWWCLRRTDATAVMCGSPATLHMAGLRRRPAERACFGHVDRGQPGDASH